MTQENLIKIQESLFKILKENPDLFKYNEEKNWYLRRKQFLENNNILYEKLKQEFSDITKEELINMQKLYLIYPHGAPLEFLSLSWDKIKIIINLCERDKRDFYINLCYCKDIDLNTLKEYILNDLYEKVDALCLEILDIKEIKKKDFYDKVIEISTLIWNK